MTRVSALTSRIKLRHLKAVLAIEESGSMLKAAEKLSLSQSVISKTINDLEAILGVRLFERGPRGVELTAAGREVVRRAISVFDDLETGVQEIRRLADPMAGEVSFGHTEAMAFSLIPAMIRSMARDYPRVRFDLVQGEPLPLIERDLRGRRVEFVLARGPVTQAADLSSEVLCRDRLTIIAGLTNPIAKRRKLSLDDLVNARWAMPPEGHPVRMNIIKAFEDRGLRPPANVVATGGALITTRMVACGDFISVIGSAAIELDAPSLGVKALPIDLKLPDWYISIISLKKRPPGPLAELVIKCAKSTVASLNR